MRQRLLSLTSQATEEDALLASVGMMKRAGLVSNVKKRGREKKQNKQL
jgi:hypothetical protein